MARPRLSPAHKACVSCGVLFAHDPQRARLTCSRECNGAMSRARRLGKKFPGAGGARRRSDKERTCVICGIVFPLTAGQAGENKRTCTRACANELLSRTKGGLTELACEGCGTLYEISRYYKRTGRRFCSDPCRLRWFKNTPVGESNPCWRGGYEPYYGPSWRVARRAAWKRDKESCVRCGLTREEMGKRPDVHHLVPFRTFGRARHAEANQLHNLMSLCRRCHTKLEANFKRTP